MGSKIDGLSPSGVSGLVAEISALIHKHTGIQLGARQVAMVESRLKRRAYEVGLDGLDGYPAYFAANRAEETEALISLITTHHTFFFREFVQFEFLEERLPNLVAQARKRGARTLEVYSAACSRGQEVYSLAMFLDRHLKDLAPDFDFRILGTDVDGASVEVARNAVYRREEIKSVPLAYLGDHWARGSGDIAEFVKARKSLRARCEFSKLNLLDLAPLAGRKFDVIFCRNVFIYFTPPQIKDIASRLLHHLLPGGLFFVGVSESLNSLSLPVTAVGSSIYAAEPAPPALSVASTAPVPAKPAADRIRVVCVDDSASILTLLGRVLGRDQGFEVVGTAANGEEAERVVAQCKPDVITLDIHMPVRTGIEFLASAKARGLVLPPVVMVTSVSRDDVSLAWKALELGAADYVEKPALHNLELRAEEIRAKLRSAHRLRGRGRAVALDRQFARAHEIKNPQACAGLVVLGMGDLDRCVVVVKDMILSGIPLYLALEGADSLLPAVAERLSRGVGYAIGCGANDPAPKVTAVLGSLGSLVPRLKTGRAMVAAVFGEISKPGATLLASIPGISILLEDLGGGRGATHLAAHATEVVLPTSFPYLCVEQLFRAEARRKSA